MFIVNDIRSNRPVFSDRAALTGGIADSALVEAGIIGQRLRNRYWIRILSDPVLASKEVQLLNDGKDASSQAA